MDRAELLIMVNATAVPDNVSVKVDTEEMKQKKPRLFEPWGETQRHGTQINR
jgi:hypothetical protein